MSSGEIHRCFAFAELVESDQTSPDAFCWEAVQCGREPGGIREDNMGVCSVASRFFSRASDVAQANVC